MTVFIVFADGGSRGNPGAAAYGALVISAIDGRVLAERAGYLGIQTNNYAEYNGLIAGLEAVAELNREAPVHVRMDSKLVVEQMSGRWKIKHPDMRTLAVRASKILPAHLVKYEWVPRADNALADALVNEALDAALSGWLEPISRDLNRD